MTKYWNRFWGLCCLGFSSQKQAVCFTSFVLTFVFVTSGLRSLRSHPPYENPLRMTKKTGEIQTWWAWPIRPKNATKISAWICSKIFRIPCFYPVWLKYGDFLLLWNRYKLHEVCKKRLFFRQKKIKWGIKEIPKGQLIKYVECEVA